MRCHCVTRVSRLLARGRGNLLALAALAALALTAHGAVDQVTKADFRLVFGSCNRHDRTQTLWPHVRELMPDAFLWLGDAIYADGKQNGTRVYFGKAGPGPHRPHTGPVWDSHAPRESCLGLTRLSRVPFPLNVTVFPPFAIRVGS
jgi:hypothetical protein